jgi:branched-chain amino acid transport system substrate-binding protein
MQVQAITNGARLVFDRTNRNGGIHGRQIALTQLDDGLQPTRTAENCEVLIREQQISAMFGFVGSANMLAADAVLRKVGIPVVGAFAVSDSARLKTQGTAYYVRAGYGREAERIVQQVTTLGMRHVGIAYFANPGGDEVKKILSDELARLNLQPVATAAVNVDGSNVSEAAKVFANAKPQAVILHMGGSVPAKLISALEGLSTFPSYYGMSVVSGEVTARELGSHLRSLAIAQVVPYPWSTTTPPIADFRALATGAGVPVSYSSFEGYVTALVLCEALKRAGKNPSPTELHAALRGFRGRLAGTDIDFTNGLNTGSRFVELVHITGTGSFVR